MVETVVLFGAGASYGAGDIVPNPPPLGGGLFSELRSTFPFSWGSLPRNLTTAFDDDFERGMLELQNFNSTLYAPLYRDMGLYFAQFSPGLGRTLYDDFVAEFSPSISSGDLIFSSLNYECVLEHSLSEQGHAISYFAEPDEEGACVLKLHGSCNFLSQGLEASGIQFTEGIMFDGGLKAVQRREAAEYCRSNTALYPAMALFRPDKHVQVGSNTIEAVQQTWADAIEDASKIAVIGVYPQPHDTHIWDIISDSDAQIFYIGSQDAFEEWCDDNRPDGKDTFVSNRFDDGFNDLVAGLS